MKKRLSDDELEKLAQRCTYSEATLTVGDHEFKLNSINFGGHEYERDVFTERFGWPTCAVCGRPVDHLESARDFLRNTTIFVARCHGAREEVEVDVAELLDSKTRFGVAFATKELPRGDR